MISPASCKRDTSMVYLLSTQDVCPRICIELVGLWKECVNPPLTVHHENCIKTFSNVGHILQSEIPISICDVNMTISNSWPNNKISHEMSTFPQKPTYFLKIHGWIPFNVLLKSGPFSGFFRGQKVLFKSHFFTLFVGFGNPPEAQAPQICGAE